MKCWGHKWCSADAERWRDPADSVFCRGSEKEKISQLDRRDAPPPWCQYKLEHGLHEVMEKEDAVG